VAIFIVFYISYFFATSLLFSYSNSL